MTIATKYTSIENGHAGQLKYFVSLKQTTHFYSIVETLCVTLCVIIGSSNVLTGCTLMYNIS